MTFSKTRLRSLGGGLGGGREGYFSLLFLSTAAVWCVPSSVPSVYSNAKKKISHSTGPRARIAVQRASQSTGRNAKNISGPGVAQLEHAGAAAWAGTIRPGAAEQRHVGSGPPERGQQQGV